MTRITSAYMTPVSTMLPFNCWVLESRSSHAAPPHRNDEAVGRSAGLDSDDGVLTRCRGWHVGGCANVRHPSENRVDGGCRKQGPNPRKGGRLSGWPTVSGKQQHLVEVPRSPAVHNAMHGSDEARSGDRGARSNVHRGQIAQSGRERPSCRGRMPATCGGLTRARSPRPESGARRWQRTRRSAECAQGRR